MLKESTRKGWAGVLAAGLAVAGLSVGAAPANAAPSSITIAPISGTNTNALSGAYFLFATTAIGAAATEDIHYQIEGALGSDFTNDVIVVNTTDITAGGKTDLTLVTGDATTDVQTKVTDDLISVIDPTSAGAYAQGDFQIVAIAADVSSKTTVTITPFLEEINDGVLTTNEVKGNSLEVTFWPADEIVATTNLTLGAIGNNADTAQVSFSEVNMASLQELSGGVLGNAKFIKNGDTASEDIFTIDASEYDPAKGLFVVDNDGGDTEELAAGNVLTAAAQVLGEDYGSADLEIMGASNAASLDATLSFSPTAGLDYRETDDAHIRAGSGSFTVTANVNPDTDKDITGEEVTFKIEETGVAALGSGSVTVNGTVLSNSLSAVTEDITVVAEADADGDAVLNISYAGLKDGNEFKVTATINVGSNNSAEAKFTAEDAVPTTVVDNDPVTGHKQIVAGSTTTHTFTVLDQFGQPYTAAPTRLRYGYSGNSGITPASSNGVHTISLTDNNTAAASEVLAITDYDITSGADETADVDLGGGTTSIDIDVRKTALQSAARVVISGEESDDQGNTTSDIADTTLAALDTRLASSGDVSTVSDHSFDVTVYDSVGALAVGALVTVTTSDEVLLSDGTRQAFGTMQFRTDGSGKIAVYYDTNSEARHDFTVTSGTGSDTTFIDFGPITDIGEVSSVELDAPASVQPGATLTATATLKDKYGNPVNITSDTTGDGFLFSWDGPGLVVGGAPTETGSAGTAVFRVLMGQNDTGSGTFTVRVDTDEDPSTVLDVTTVQQTVTIGTAAGPFTGTYGDVTAWTVNQNDGTAKVYVKFPTVGDKVRIGHQTGGSGSYETIYVKTTSSETMDGLRQVAGVGTYIVRTIDLASGTNRIRVDVGDDRLVQVRYND